MRTGFGGKPTPKTTIAKTIAPRRIIEAITIIAVLRPFFAPLAGAGSSEYVASAVIVSRIVMRGKQRHKLRIMEVPGALFDNALFDAIG
jgi:hypothetical protein